MNIFTVYAHPTKGLVAIKQGFCWPALFFGPAWVIACNLWLVLGAIALIVGLIAMLPHIFNQMGFLSVISSHYPFGIHVALGLMGNKLRREDLSTAGFRRLSQSIARSPADAIKLSGHSLTTKSRKLVEIDMLYPEKL